MCLILWKKNNRSMVVSPVYIQALKPLEPWCCLLIFFFKPCLINFTSSLKNHFKLLTFYLRPSSLIGKINSYLEAMIETFCIKPTDFLSTDFPVPTHSVYAFSLFTIIPSLRPGSLSLISFPSVVLLDPCNLNQC